MKRSILAALAAALSLGLPQVASAGFHYVFAPMLVIHHTSPVIADARPTESLPIARHEEQGGASLAAAHPAAQARQDITGNDLPADMPRVSMTQEP
jgi:hypothetical protein